MKTKAKKSNVGRITGFKPEYCQRAYELSLLGAIDIDLADIFGVAKSSINNWKKIHPEFLDSIKRGKKIADAKVAERLFTRATGYTFDEKKVEKEGKKILKTTTTKKEIAPDPIAAIFWLKNRQPKDWRDKQEIEMTINPFMELMQKATGGNDNK